MKKLKWNENWSIQVFLDGIFCARIEDIKIFKKIQNIQYKVHRQYLSIDKHSDQRSMAP